MGERVNFLNIDDAIDAMEVLVLNGDKGEFELDEFELEELAEDSTAS